MIPSELYARIKRFIEDERTGTISLNLNRGRIESWDIREHQKACGSTTKQAISPILDMEAINRSN